MFGPRLTAAAFLTTATALAVRSAFLIVTVTGQSMVPTYAEGDRVLVRRSRRSRRGSVVVFRGSAIGDDRARRAALVLGPPDFPDGDLPAGRPPAPHPGLDARAFDVPGEVVPGLGTPGRAAPGRDAPVRVEPAYRDDNPSRRLVMKRVDAVAGDLVPEDVLAAVGAEPGDRVPRGLLVVRGDGTRSTDSRHWGYLPVEAVVGHVVADLSSPGGGSGRPHSRPSSVAR